MKGTRPLDNSEIRIVSACFDGNPFGDRNRGLFMLGVSTGGRISELLSLTIRDVYQNRAAVTDLLYDKSIVKGGEVSRAVPVNKDGRQAIADLIAWHRERYQNIKANSPLFPSRNGHGTQRMSRRTAHDVLKKAFEDAGLNRHLATHSLRKSFAQRLYERTGDIFAVQEMLGHKSVATTQKYLGVNYASVRKAVEEMTVSAELHETVFLGSSLKKEADETLFLELARRGYDLSSVGGLYKPDSTDTPKSSNSLKSSRHAPRAVTSNLRFLRWRGFPRETPQQKHLALLFVVGQFI